MTSTYLVNMSPSTVLCFKTLEYLWPGKVHDYCRLKVFGCATYAHQSEKKLEPKSVKCVFLGYFLGVKRYRLWVRKC